MEGELRAAHARGCGEGTPDSSLNIALEVKVCDQFREAQNPKFTGKGNVVAVERVFDERLGIDPVGDEQDVPMEKKEAVPGALDMKCEPADSDRDLSESVLFTGDWLEVDTKTSQSQKIIEETCYGPSGAVATADNDGEGPLCYKEELPMQPCTAGDPEQWLQAELKQEPDGESVEAESTPGEAAAKGAEGPLCEEEEQHMQPCPAGDQEKGLLVEMEQEVGDEQDVPMEKKEAVPGALDMKCEPADSDRDLSESVLFTGDWLEVDTKTSQSQKIIEETCYGPSGAVATADNDGEGPLCYKEELPMQPCTAGDPEQWLQAELKQEPDGESVEAESTPGEAAAKGAEGPLCEEEEQHMQPCPAGDQEKGLLVETEQEVGDEQDVPMEKKEAVPGALDMKCEPADSDRDWSESVLFTGDWLEVDTKTSQSQKIIEETCYGPSGAVATADNDGEGPLCYKEELPMQPCTAGEPEQWLQAELKQEPDGESVEAESTPGEAAAKGGEGPLCEEEEQHIQPCPAGDQEKGLHVEMEQEGEPLNPGHPLPGSAGGLEVQCVRSKSTRSGKVQEMVRYYGGSSEHGGARSNDQFSPRNFRASRRLRAEKNKGPSSHLEQQQNGSPHSILEKNQRRKKLFTCSGCDKTFSHRHTLQAHQSVHTGEKQHICRDCGNCFPFKSYLKNHQCVHTREKPFDCTQCGKSFSHNSSLKTHQITHTREKWLCCTLCNKSFPRLHSLNRHQRVHTGEKPFSCDQCGKSFAQLGHLKCHQMVHAGEKQFSCDKFWKSFTQLWGLKTHQRLHTGEKPFSCDECGKSFTTKGNLKTHQRVHVREKPAMHLGLQKHMLTHS